MFYVNEVWKHTSYGPFLYISNINNVTRTFHKHNAISITCTEMFLCESECLETEWVYLDTIIKTYWCFDMNTHASYHRFSEHISPTLTCFQPTNDCLKSLSSYASMHNPKHSCIFLQKPNITNYVPQKSSIRHSVRSPEMCAVVTRDSM